MAVHAKSCLILVVMECYITECCNRQACYNSELEHYNSFFRKKVMDVFDHFQKMTTK